MTTLTIEIIINNKPITETIDLGEIDEDQAVYLVDYLADYVLYKMKRNILLDDDY